jgi:hypothetical protein
MIGMYLGLKVVSRHGRNEDRFFFLSRHVVFVASRREGKPPLISGACGARCAAVYIGTSGQHGVCKREADSLAAAVCSNQAARSPAKNKVCSLPLSFLCDFGAKPDTAHSRCSHEYVRKLNRRRRLEIFSE